MQCINLNISLKKTAGMLCMHCQQGHNMYSGYEVSNCSKPQTAHLKVTCSWLHSMCFACDNLLNVVLEWFLRPVEASADSVPHCALEHKEIATHSLLLLNMRMTQSQLDRMSLCMRTTTMGLTKTSAQSAQAFGTPMHMAKQVQCPSLYRHPAATTLDAIAEPNTL